MAIERQDELIIKVKGEDERPSIFPLESGMLVTIFFELQFAADYLDLSCATVILWLDIFLESVAMNMR